MLNRDGNSLLERSLRKHREKNSQIVRSANGKTKVTFSLDVDTDFTLSKEAPRSINEHLRRSDASADESQESDQQPGDGASSADSTSTAINEDPLLAKGQDDGTLVQQQGSSEFDERTLVATDTYIIAVVLSNPKILSDLPS